MKKLTTICCSLAIIALVTFTPSVFAGGLSVTTTLQALSASAPADGKTTIIFKVFGYIYGCKSPAYSQLNGTCSDGSTPGNQPVSGATVWVGVTGSGYTLGGDFVSSPKSPYLGYVVTGSDGYATITMSSATVGSDTMTVAGGDNQPTATVSFTTPVAAAPKITPKTVTPTPAPAPAPAPPAAPTTGVELNNQTVASADKPTVQAGKTINLSGTTVPNGVVTLYIFSTPRQATVTADAQGKWSYEISGLEAGSHHVEATVTDPATKLASVRTTLASFTIAKAPAATIAAKPAAAKKQAPVLLWVIGGIVALGLLAGVVAWRLRKRHANSSNTSNSSAPTPPAEPSDTTDTTGPPQSE